MRTNIGSVAILLGMMGIVTSVAASERNASSEEKRGLSPITVLISCRCMPSLWMVHGKVCR